jgi:hypothetical protein
MQIRLFAAMLVMGVAAMAQEFRGTILGRITDSSGAIIGGAAIQVVNTDTNVTVSTTSNQDGNYQVPFLNPGNYRVVVDHPGFKKTERQNIRVSVTSQVALDFALEVGAVNETVNVTASAPLLNTNDADLGQVINSNYVTQVAIDVHNGRNVINLARFAPGVGGGTGTYSSNSQAQFSINGGGSTQNGNEFMVDGIPNTVPTGGGLITFVPSLDSVEEVKVQTTMFDAAYGHTNGGAVNIVTKGGTNQLHGAVYNYKRWRALNANNWTNNRVGTPNPPVNYDQYGYTIGGPVYIPKVFDGRNRTFFSTSLERDHDNRDGGHLGRLPTAAERQGNFSQTLSAVGGPFALYDPNTTAVNNGRATRTPFPNATIPASQLSPIGVAALGLLPLPNQAGATQIGKFNWAETAVYTVQQKQWSVRIDEYLSANQRLFARVSRLERDVFEHEFFPGDYNWPVNGGLNTVELRPMTSIALDDTFTLSPTFIGSVRYGLSRRFSTIQIGGYGLDPAALKLPAAIVNNQATRGYPIFNLGENMPTIGSSLSNLANDVHAVLVTMTKLIRSHSVKFGIDYRLTRLNQLSPGAAGAGTFNFSSTFTRSDPFTPSSGNTSGSAIASLLLGIPDSGSLGYTSPLSLQNHYLAGFVQETWRVNSKLTLNFGLRYDLETPYTERYNRVTYGFDFAAPLPAKVPGLDLRGGAVFAGVNGAPRREGNLDSNNFAPRFGFAWGVAPKTVVRGGYGLFYSSQIENSSFLGQVSAFDSITPYVGTIDSGATPFTTLANPFPAGFNVPPGSSAGLNAQIGNSLTFVNPGRVSPYNQQWQFSVQRQMPSNIVVEAAYVGMLSLKELGSFNLNELPDQYLPRGNEQNNRVPNPFLGVFPATSTLGQGTTITQRQLWLGYPQFTSLAMDSVNAGRSVYHALQTKLDKRLSHGLSLLFSYTFSKLMTNVNSSASYVNDRHFYRGISRYDEPHLVRAVLTYAPSVKFQRSTLAGKFADGVLGGWTVAGYYTYESGTPLSISQANGRPFRIRNEVIGGPVESRLGDRRDAQGRVLNPYFDINAFQPLASQYVISPDPQYLAELRAPAGHTLNAFLYKSFRILERLRLEVNMQAESVTNSPNFNSPGTNMSNLATFGVISTAGGGNRQMQAGMRLVF